MLNDNYSNEAFRRRISCCKSGNAECLMLTSALLNYEVQEAEELQHQIMYSHQSSSDIDCLGRYTPLEDHVSRGNCAEDCGYTFLQDSLSVEQYIDFSGQTAHQNQQYVTAFEPQTVLRHLHSPSANSLRPLATIYDNVGIPHGPEHSPLNDTPSSFLTSSYSDPSFVSNGWQSPKQVTNNNENRIASTPTMDHADDFDPACDKPYAQLIWEALKQAPGYRMMLRDIYDWFVIHTNKPSESGTNGWQNSIRHNLSMNKAFENDKSNPAGSKSAKKANSVWLLTKDAAQNGVHPTTRFRKTIAAKKGSSNHPPAAQRQQSGAKGGRAARRAARLRRQEEHKRQALPSDRSPTNTSQSVGEYPRQRLQDQDSGRNFCPPTPTDQNQLGTLYSLPPDSYPTAYPLQSSKHEAESLLTYTGDVEELMCVPTLASFFDNTSESQYTDLL